jgi:hypothetical protein
VELRLRSAGLTPGNDIAKNKSYLHVNVTILGSAFGISVEYQRPVDFTTGNRQYRHVTAMWESSTPGIHGGDAAYIINQLDPLLDEFLNEYLKANQK